VIDSRALGGKARVVWLSAGDRELMVAVSAQQVRLLGQWRRNRDNALEAIEPSDGAAPPLARGSAPRLAGAGQPRGAGHPAPPRQAGAARRRHRVGRSEADEQWARDILAATGGP
jgi:hypothetical protein